MVNGKQFSFTMLAGARCGSTLLKIAFLLLLADEDLTFRFAYLQTHVWKLHIRWKTFEWARER